MTDARMQRDPAVSIIVPVYQTGAYLRKCLDSILAQTIDDFEVVVVDDGSRDESPAICDEYAAKDPRVHVVHQPNGGRSVARNTGLAHAKGAWIGFVDSDDWVEPNMYEALLGAVQAQGAQIAVCGRIEEHPGSEPVRICRDGESPLSPADALAELVADTAVRSYLCDKLFDRRLFEGIVFPLGRNYEDVAVVYQLFDRADRIAFSQVFAYHYIFHEANIVRDESLSNRVDYWLSARERYEALAPRYPELEGALALDVMRVNAICWSLAWGARGNDKAVFERVRADMVVFAGKHCRSAREASKYGRLGHAWLKLTQLNCMCAFFLSSVLSRRLDR